MKATSVIITPDQAKKLLQSNSRNRPLRKKYVQLLAKEIKHGRWVLNGFPIITSGKLLIDGQHRLAACVVADRSFPTMLITDADANIFPTIDVGKKRSAADTLSVVGRKNSTTLAAAASIVNVYHSGAFDERFIPRDIPSNRMVLETMKEHPQLERSVDFCLPFNTRICPTSIMCACHYIFARINKREADAFIRSLSKGNDLKEGSPMFKLREKLLENYTSIRKHSRGYLTSLLIETWNAERSDGKRLVPLRGWSGGDKATFPIAI